jgi:membrane carboxypeptidase/penicillin-binding protein
LQQKSKQGLQELLKSIKKYIQHLSEKIIISSAIKFHKNLNTPIHLIICLFLIEDKRFIIHCGIDLIAVIRSIIINIKLRGIYEGGSTITQQLYNSRREISGKIYQRNLSDKIKQFFWAIKHERETSKLKILEEYLDKIYVGKLYYGIDQGAKNYFDGTRESLTPSQSLFLIERIACPNYIDLVRVKKILKEPMILKYILKNPKDLVELIDIYDSSFDCGNELSKNID